MRVSIIAAALGLLASGEAGHADSFTAGDLGIISSRADCMSLGAEAFRIYAEELDVEPRISTGDWMVAAYGLPTEAINVQIMCPDTREDGADVLNGYIVAHESFDVGTTERGVATLVRIIEIFKELKTAL